MDELPFWTHTVSLAADSGSPGRARDFVRDHLLQHGLPGLVDDVRLVVSELTTNVVEHAQTPFSLTLAREGHSVLLSVQDASPRLPRAVVSGSSHLRGRGLQIVDRLSSGWGVETTDGLKAVWAHFDTGRTMAPEW